MLQHLKGWKRLMLVSSYIFSMNRKKQYIAYSCNNILWQYKAAHFLHQWYYQAIHISCFHKQHTISTANILYTYRGNDNNATFVITLRGLKAFTLSCFVHINSLVTIILGIWNRATFHSLSEASTSVSENNKWLTHCGQVMQFSGLHLDQP